MVTFEKNAFTVRIETPSPVEEWLNFQTGFASAICELHKRLDEKYPLDSDLLYYLPRIQEEFLKVNSSQMFAMQKTI